MSASITYKQREDTGRYISRLQPRPRLICENEGRVGLEEDRGRAILKIRVSGGKISLMLIRPIILRRIFPCTEERI